VLYPVVNLKSEEEVMKFLDSEPIGDYYPLMGKHVRVIGFFSDKKEYSNEYKHFQAAA